MRLERDDSLLLVVDLQQKLMPTIEGQVDLIRRTEALVQAAGWFGVPRLTTEHCAPQIGPIIEPLRSQFAARDIIPKAAFPATGEPAFMAALHGCGRRQVVVTGVEAHICVLQTVLGLREQGFHAFVVADAVGSRGARGDDRVWAMQRMQQAGAELVSTDTVLFEWTRRADDPHFRKVLGLVKALG